LEKFESSRNRTRRGRQLGQHVALRRSLTKWAGAGAILQTP
jgi:hypothetical protein